MRGYLLKSSIVALVFIAGAAAVSGASEADRSYQRGMQAYGDEQWSLAIQEFESILLGGYEADVLYYNLGNAYYRAGHNAGAVWAYEKALQLHPSDEDIRYNLTLANLHVQDRIAPPEIPLVLRLYRGVRESFTTTEWVRWISLIMLLLSLFHALSRLWGWNVLRWLITPGLALAVCMSLVAADSLIKDRTLEEGIIYAELAEVYSAPSERSTKLFELHEGLKVSIVEQGDQWYYIELMDGKNGWIAADLLRAL